MPVDSSIYGNLRAIDIGGAMKDGLAIKEAKQRNAAYEAEAARKQKMADISKASLGADGMPDQKLYVQNLGKAGFGEEALKAQRESREDQIKNFQAQREQLGFQAQLIGSATDDATWMAAKEQAKAAGADTSKLPDYFDPKLKEYLLGSTLTAKDRLENEWKQKGFDLDKQKFEQSVNQFDKTFGLNQEQFGYTKEKDKKSFGLEQQKFGYQQSKDAADRGLEEKKLQQKRAEESGITVGRKEVDKQFGKDYQDWTSSGRPTVDKNLQRLRDAMAKLQNDSSLSGPGKALLPDKLRAFTNPDAIAVRDNVRAAAQGALKATLGAQFTEKEGERIMNQAYNEALSPEENVKKIMAAIEELEAQRDMNERKSAYFQRNGTLTGFDATATAQAKNLEALPDDELDALFNQLQGK